MTSKAEPRGSTHPDADADRNRASGSSSSASSTASAAAATSRELPPDAGKVLPPQSPVDVPNQPRPAGKNDPDEAAAQGNQKADTDTESNWADGSKPQPRAKNARTHLF